MLDQVRLGMLTPSSNTVLEPMTCAILSGVPEITAHFARLRVTEITLSDVALGQFDHSAQLAAAGMLADAHIHAIAWNGTSGGWIGFEADRQLCRALSELTGVPATTSTLALLDALDACEVRRFGLVTPYLDEVQERIVRNYADAGYDCMAERHLGDRGNFSFAGFGEPLIERLVREVAAEGPDAIAIYCTNFRGTRVAPRLEAELGIPVLDSVAVTAWRSLIDAGSDPGRITGWGQLFGLSAQANHLTDRTREGRH